jgi:O-methyltransferase
MTLAIKHNTDRLVPAQPALSHMYTGEPSRFYSKLETLLNSVLPTQSIEMTFDIVGKDGLSYYALGSDLTRLRFYQFLIHLTGARSVLELGTFIGVSTLFLAQAVGESGHVTSVESGTEFHALARRNVEANGFAERVTLILGDALAALTCRRTEDCVDHDMIIIDAAKEHYPKLLAASLCCLKPGGLILIDDVFMNGETLNPNPLTEKGAGVRHMMEAARGLAEFEKIILPIGNGLLMLRHRGTT